MVTLFISLITYVSGYNCPCGYNVYSILGGYKSSFCCQDNKEELGIVTTINFILFLVGVDYVLVTQTLVKEVRTRYLANTMLVG